MMSNQSTAKAWLEAETARRYQLFAQQTTMYQELSRMIVELAGIEPGMSVLDLGCGTGVTTQAVLTELGERGRVYALDLSAAMLDVAGTQHPSEQVTFVQADAGDFAGLIPKPVDRGRKATCLCSSRWPRPGWSRRWVAKPGWNC